MALSFINKMTLKKIKSRIETSRTTNTFISEMEAERIQLSNSIRLKVSVKVAYIPLFLALAVKPKPYNTSIMSKKHIRSKWQSRLKKLMLTPKNSGERLRI